MSNRSNYKMSRCHKSTDAWHSLLFIECIDHMREQSITKEISICKMY